MTAGEKVLCVFPVPKAIRKFIKPVPKIGWVYLVEDVLTLPSQDGDNAHALKLAGIKNLKDENGKCKFLGSGYFVPLCSLRAANQLRKQGRI